MLSESEAMEVLKERSSFPPLDLSVRREAPLVGDRRADGLLEARWGEWRYRFAIEYQSWASPKNLRAAMAQIRALVSENSDAELLPLVVAPYLDGSALDRLLEAEISGLDLSGNGVFIVPGTWLIYRAGSPNQYPSSRPIKRIFAGKSSLIGQVLLLRGEFDQVSAVQKEIERRGGEISLPTVSKVLSALDEELLIEKDRGTVELLQPERLLDRLAEEYELPQDLRRRRGRLRDDAIDARVLSRRAQERDLRLAVSGVGRYVSAPSSDRLPPIYTESLEKLVAPEEFDEAARFADVEFRETDDLLLYFDRREAEGVLWTSPLQTYFELAAGGVRDREAAAELRQKILAGSAR